MDRVWESRQGYTGDALLAGDLGWHLRLPDDQVDGAVHTWWDHGHLAAVALVEEPVARPRLALAAASTRPPRHHRG